MAPTLQVGSEGGGDASTAPVVPPTPQPVKAPVSRIGIIYPPPEIRNIVDKTAGFVARNGPEFEARIKQNEAKNPKFNFLNPTDPYYAYFQHKVKDFQEGKAVEPTAPKAAAPASKLQDLAKPVELFVPKEPPKEFEFSADPATIHAFELDIIKLTAQFVARNGRQFLTQLMNRESRNSQFDFLKPQHSMFNYFTKLVEQYTKVLIPPKSILTDLRREASSYKEIMRDVNYRVEWEKHQRRLKQAEEAEVEKERVAYGQIDWHDFVVVQTVDFQAHEHMNLPPPCNPKDVGARVLAQQRQLEINKAAAPAGGTTGEEMEVESSSESEEEAEEGGSGSEDEGGAGTDEARRRKKASSDEDEPSEEIVIEKEGGEPAAAASTVDSQQPIPLPPKPEQVVIRKGYDPRAAKADKPAVDTKWVISPLTGEKIPADQLASHMRFNTVDQQYFQQKERELEEKKDEEPVYAAGVDISANIKEFAARRTDIFGRGVEETMIGRKIGEEQDKQVDPKTIWDGYSSSVEQTAQAVASQITLQEQIAQIHRSKGLIPDHSKERIGPKGTEGGVPPAPPNEPPQPTPPPPPVAPPAPPAPPRTQVPPIGMLAPRTMSIGAPPAVVPVLPVAPQPVMVVQQNPVRLHVQPGGIRMIANPGPPMMPQPQMISQGPPRPPMPQMPPMRALIPPPTPLMTAGQSAGGGPQPGGGQQASSDSAEPPSKRQKTEDQLIPEHEFLSQHNGHVKVFVAVPSSNEKPEWKLGGQTLQFTMPLGDPISVIKAKIQEAIGMPASKQKLIYDGFFVKDSNSLAFYNMADGAVVQLQMKERGGRKR